MHNQESVVRDLIAEANELEQLLITLDDAQWRLATPAPGWTIAHQVGHLVADFHLAGLAASDPAAFRAVSSRLGKSFDSKVDAALEWYLDRPAQELLTRWRAELELATRALVALPADEPVPWLSRPLTASILACAGIMELFAHGQDIYDTLGLRRTYTDRVRHVVAFSLGNWEAGYLARGLTPPAVEVRFELSAPSGAVWQFGPAGAPQRITGPAVDFCLLTTRRRHRADLQVTAVGREADAWLDIAQAYRGDPGTGRAPGQFRT